MYETHYCKAQTQMAENNIRQKIKVEQHWYGWAIDFGRRPENVQIEFCPWCGIKLRDLK